MFRFEPTANLADFDQIDGLKEAWSEFINGLYETNLYGDPTDRVQSALEELRLWGRSDRDLRVYNPASMPIPSGSDLRTVIWSALPTSFDDQFSSTREKLDFMDKRQPFPGDPSRITRIQDEYCEWVVKRNDQKEITEVIFTSEPPEYYDFLFFHSDESRQLLVELYKRITSIDSITLEQLINEAGEYDWYNQYNNDFAVHMQQPNNTLGAQVNIVSRSCILRFNKLGVPIADALGLIRCGRYGDPNRQSDPSIGNAINIFARENRFITIENPVGLYIANVDLNGWVTPDGTDPKSFFSVIRGTQTEDPNKSFIVRAVFSVPANKGYTVSDIKIGGENIEFGSQIAARINVRVSVLVSEPTQLPEARSIGCTGTVPTILNTPMALSLPNPTSLSRRSNGRFIFETGRR